MKPQRFEIGQAVTPKNDQPWTKADANAVLPQIGEIYHVAEYEWREKQWCIGLSEIPNVVHEERGFGPVELTDADIHELVEQSISQPA